MQSKRGISIIVGSEVNALRPIPPRVLAMVTLYGLVIRIRSSRALEESLRVRLGFRWLAEGRTIDHTTLSEFRRKRGDALKNLFIQVRLVARQMGCGRWNNWPTMEHGSGQTIAVKQRGLRRNRRASEAATKSTGREA